MDKKRHIIYSLVVSALFTTLEAALLLIDRGIMPTAAALLALLFVIQAVVLYVMFQKVIMGNISRVYSTGLPAAAPAEKEH